MTSSALRVTALAAAVIALAACGGASYSSSPSSASSPAGQPAATQSAAGAAAAVSIQLQDFQLSPSNVTVHTGDTIEVVNAGKAPHNLAYRDASGRVIAAIPELKPGSRAMLKIDAPAGSYTMFCQVPGHESLGMRGTLTVN